MRSQVLRDPEKTLMGLAIVKTELRFQSSQPLIDRFRRELARIGFLRRQQKGPGHVERRNKRVERTDHFEQGFQRVIQDAVEMDLKQAAGARLREKQAPRVQPG